MTCLCFAGGCEAAAQAIHGVENEFEGSQVGCRVAQHALAHFGGDEGARLLPPPARYVGQSVPKHGLCQR